MASKNSSSAAAKRLAEEKASRKGKRTDRNNLSGMGMTRSGVEQRANDAFLRNYQSNMGGASMIEDQRMDPYDTVGFVTDLVTDGPELLSKPYKQVESESLAKANKMRSRYGIASKDMAGQNISLSNKGKSPKYSTWNDPTPRVGRK